MIFKNDIKLLKIIKSTTPTLPNMLDFEKGYLLGKIGSLAAASYMKQEEQKEHVD